MRFMARRVVVDFMVGKPTTAGALAYQNQGHPAAWCSMTIL